ncbi:MAG: VWA domain-containing protein [Planctomycetaceae bacterium]|nr:VWA domain-containing protein [Planctomycetaceae bacterium]
MLNLLAQADPRTTSTTLEFDWPYTAGDWFLVALLLVASLFTIWMCYRDTRRMSRGWTIWLTSLRLLVLAALFVIALNPHLRSQSEAYRPSHVALLVDTSTSMQQPEMDPRDAAAANRSRTDAVRDLLEKSPLLDELRKQHVVDVYTFDSDLSGVRARFPTMFQPDLEGSASSVDAVDPEIDWQQVLESGGQATSLGDALDKLLAEIQSPTLSGVVVISDGAVNAGREVRVARERAEANGTRLIAVGVGSTTPPVNLTIAKVIIPTDVQKGDVFELAAILQAEGLSGKLAEVELLQKHPDEQEPTVVDRREVSIPEDAEPFEVQFERNPAEPGEYEYTLRARVADVAETRLEDNIVTRQVNIFDRPLRVLIVAGGPMRDYRFARTLLYRHPSMEVDLWLQSGEVGISQDANRVLYKFPDARDEFFQYDVLLAFDPDWSQLTQEQQDLLDEWVSDAGGGMVLVAGDVFTPQLAAAGQELATISKLYPVLLDEVGLRLGARDEATTAYPVGLTQEGEAAEFLKLSEGNEEDVWETFRGVYRCYPTRGVKAGTTIYAEFTDPLARGAGGQPVLIGAQRYGQGQILYIGSPEFWRLRAIKEEFLDRLWTKMVRKAAEGRSKRGLQRGLFILEGRDYDVGQTVPLRVRVVNSQFQPLDADEIEIEVYDPNGRPQVPAPRLLRDRHRPSEYTGDLRVALPGRYRLELQIPDSAETISEEVNAQLSRLEAASLVQNVRVLESLVGNTGGRYLTLAAAATEVPALLVNQGESTVIDEQIQEQWDRWWLLLTLATLLSLEWLSRKLLRLA